MERLKRFEDIAEWIQPLQTDGARAFRIKDQAYFDRFSYRTGEAVSDPPECTDELLHTWDK
jgi:radical SAM superfamily enzyme with C-terminal helix-hairpin-helix motif